MVTPHIRHQAPKNKRKEEKKRSKKTPTLPGPHDTHQLAINTPGVITYSAARPGMNFIPPAWYFSSARRRANARAEPLAVLDLLPVLLVARSPPAAPPASLVLLRRLAPALVVAVNGWPPLLLLLLPFPPPASVSVSMSDSRAKREVLMGFAPDRLRSTGFFLAVAGFAAAAAGLGVVVAAAAAVVLGEGVAVDDAPLRRRAPDRGRPPLPPPPPPPPPPPSAPLPLRDRRRSLAFSASAWRLARAAARADARACAAPLLPPAAVPLVLLLVLLLVLVMLLLRDRDRDRDRRPPPVPEAVLLGVSISTCRLPSVSLRLPASAMLRRRLLRACASFLCAACAALARLAASDNTWGSSVRLRLRTAGMAGRSYFLRELCQGEMARGGGCQHVSHAMRAHGTSHTRQPTRQAAHTRRPRSTRTPKKAKQANTRTRTRTRTHAHAP